jgi:lipopolysaccharide export system protein LptC
MTLTEKIVGVLAILVFLLITGVAKANPVLNWFETEKEKTIAFQKQSWSNAKEQTANTKQSIMNLFNKVKTNVTQN